MLKILHIAYSCIPGQFRGGVSKVVYQLACAQSALGYQVTVFATNYNSSVRVDVPLFTPIQQNDIEIRYFPVIQADLFLSPALRKELLKATGQYDVIHSHNTFLALNSYASEAHRLHNTSLYYHAHGALDPVVVNRGFVKSLRKRIYINLFERRNFNQATGIFALSQTEANHLRYYGIESPIYVVPNGISFQKVANPVDSERFRKKYNLSPEQDIILYIGRINPKKGIHLLIRAFSTLHKSFSNAVLVIAGDVNEESAYTAELYRITEAEDVAKAIVWTGFLNETEKLQAFSVADIFSHVSESEGMAMAVLEAMAAGLPTVVSKECNMTDAVSAGALVESAFDVGSLHSQLEDLLQDTTRRRNLGLMAYQYVRKHHDWHTIAQQIVEIYQCNI